MEEKRAPQLRMRLRLDGETEVPSLPEGYVLQLLDERSLADWVAVLDSTGDLGTWTVERAQAMLAAGRPVRTLADGVKIAYQGGVAVATACLTAHAGVEAAELGWVAVRPDHRQRGLGRAVCAAVLRDMQRRGYRQAFLLTDDHRPAAIRLYWSLGFRPEPTHESHARRWEDLAARLGLPLTGA